ncbi:hypothetical protein BGW39_003914, partial [Mortierella sp. 14UC]
SGPKNLQPPVIKSFGVFSPAKMNYQKRRRLISDKAGEIGEIDQIGDEEDNGEVA